MNILSMIGLMKVEDHEAAMNAKPAAQPDNSDLRRMTIGRDDWKAASLHWEAKFKAAVVDMAAQASEIEAYKEGTKALHRGLDEYMAEIKNLKSMLESEIANSRLVEADNAALKADFNQRLADAVQDYQVDAQLWRNARDKRSQGRGVANTVVEIETPNGSTFIAAPKAKKGAAK